MAGDLEAMTTGSAVAEAGYFAATRRRRRQLPIGETEDVNEDNLHEERLSGRWA